jgi:hypothetical protein
MNTRSTSIFKTQNLAKYCLSSTSPRALLIIWHNSRRINNKFKDMFPVDGFIPFGEHMS